MPLTYDHHGVKFLYPDNWQLDRQETEEGWTLAVQSPGTAFLLISCYQDRPETKAVLEITLTALRQEYSDLEAEPTRERIANHQAEGFDIDFLSLDTVNTCAIRSFRTRSCTYLILSQSSGLDEVSIPLVLQAIRVSLEVTA